MSNITNFGNFNAQEYEQEIAEIDEEFQYEFQKWLEAMHTFLMYMPIPRLGNEFAEARHNLFSVLDDEITSALDVVDKDFKH